MGSRGVRLDGPISACSNRLVRLGGRSNKKANEKNQDLPSLRTPKFLTSLKKSVSAMAKLSGATFEITCICTAKNWKEGRATWSGYKHRNTYFGAGSTDERADLLWELYETAWDVGQMRRRQRAKWRKAKLSWTCGWSRLIEVYVAVWTCWGAAMEGWIHDRTYFKVLGKRALNFWPGHNSKCCIPVCSLTTASTAHMVDSIQKELM